MLCVVVVLLTACASKLSQSVLVLDYADFGPQAMAYPLLDHRRLPWDPHAPLILGQGQIKVVVYRGVALEAVQAAYPPDRSRNIDYRYVSYSEALQYLDTQIQRNLLPRVTPRLMQARERVIAALG